jgi:hypothetical protein
MYLHILAHVKEVRPRTGHEDLQRGRGLHSSALSLTSARDVGWWSTPRPGRFTPGKQTRYLLYRGLDGPQGRAERHSTPRTVQPVESRYTDWAIPAHQLTYHKSINLHYYIASLFCIQYLLITKLQLKISTERWQSTHNVTLGRVRITTVAVEKQ